MLNDVSGIQSRYRLTFQYNADTGRTSTLSRIVYTPTGGAPLIDALNAPVYAALASSSHIVDTDGHSIRDWFDRLTKFFGELPPLVKAISGLLTALSAFFIVKKSITMIHTRARRFVHWIFVNLQPPANSEKQPKEPDVPKPVQPSRRATMVNGYAWPEPTPDLPAAILRGFEGSARGRTLKVNKSVFTIGAGDDNDLVLMGDELASAHHARLRVQSGSLYLDDLGSTNGSFLNQTKFQNETKGIAPGDTVRFGHSSFQVLNAPGRPV
jgi:hypothetical protein